jgi:hypothetical protein
MTMREMMALYMHEEGSLYQGCSRADSNGEVVLISLWRSRAEANAAADLRRALILDLQLLSLCEGVLTREQFDLSGGLRSGALRAIADRSIQPLDGL